MKARELTENQWFKWNGDWRVFQRLPGAIKVIEGKECIPAQPLQPTMNMAGAYIPADDEVAIYKEKLIKLM